MALRRVILGIYEYAAAYLYRNREATEQSKLQVVGPNKRVRWIRISMFWWLYVGFTSLNFAQVQTELPVYGSTIGDSDEDYTFLICNDSQRWMTNSPCEVHQAIYIYKALLAKTGGMITTKAERIK